MTEAPIDDLLLDRTLEASATRMNFTSRGRDFLASTEYFPRRWMSLMEWDVIHLRYNRYSVLEVFFKAIGFWSTFWTLVHTVEDDIEFPLSAVDSLRVDSRSWYIKTAKQSQGRWEQARGTVQLVGLLARTILDQ